MPIVNNTASGPQFRTTFADLVARYKAKKNQDLTKLEDRVLILQDQVDSARVKAFNPSQLRDTLGRWADEVGGVIRQLGNQHLFSHKEVVPTSNPQYKAAQKAGEQDDDSKAILHFALEEVQREGGVVVGVADKKLTVSTADRYQRSKQLAVNLPVAGDWGGLKLYAITGEFGSGTGVPISKWPIESVPVSRIVMIQDRVHEPVLDKYIKQMQEGARPLEASPHKTLVWGYKVKTPQGSDVVVVEEGHHRVAAAAIAGHNAVDMHVFDLRNWTGKRGKS